MATKTLNVRLKQKTDSKANWIANNTVLLKGEIGIESDTLKFKFGDGVTSWNQLAYAGFSSDELTDFEQRITEVTNKANKNTEDIAALDTTVQSNTASIQKNVNDIQGVSDNLANNYYTKEQIDSSIAGAFHFRGEADSFTDGNIIIDGSAVQNPKNGDVYQVGDKEYAYNSTTWVELGFNIDLSNYATKTELNGKVDKNGTDRLMTAAEGTKLAGISAGAQVNLIEKIKLATQELNIVDKTVTIPAATSTTLGVVKPSSEFTIGTDGELNINSVNVNKLEQTAGEQLILDCNASVQ